MMEFNEIRLGDVEDRLAAVMDGLSADLVVMSSRQIILEERLLGWRRRCVVLRFLPVILMPCRMDCLL